LHEISCESDPGRRDASGIAKRSCSSVLLRLDSSDRWSEGWNGQETNKILERERALSCREPANGRAWSQKSEISIMRVIGKARERIA